VLAGDDGTLYTDGVLAQGSEVFNDEALTDPTADGVYGTEDGRDITVATGVVESVSEATEAEAEEEAEAVETPAVAALKKQLDAQAATIADLTAKFNKAVPPTPRAKSTVQMADGKTTPAPKAKGAHPMDKART
jgi:hypothetical protein